MKKNRKAQIGIDVNFKKLFEPKMSKYDNLPYFRYVFFQGYIRGICEAGMITENEYEYLDRCAKVAYYEIVR